MRYAFGPFFGVLSCLLGSSLAAAGCDLSRYDREEPSAERGTVDDLNAKFSFASDAEAGPTRGEIWNYIENLSDSLALGADWEKGGIRIAMSNPLPPGKASCRTKPVENYSWTRDFESPIFYGSSNQRQDAIAFVVHASSANDTNDSHEDKTTSYASTFIGSGDSPQEIWVELTTRRLDGVLFLDVRYFPRDLLVGFSKVSEYLAPEALEVVNSEGEVVFVSTLKMLAPGDFEQLFRAGEAPEDYLFFSYKGETSSAIYESGPIRLRGEGEKLADVDAIIMTSTGVPVMRADLSALLYVTP